MRQHQVSGNLTRTKRGKERTQKPFHHHLFLTFDPKDRLEALFQTWHSNLLCPVTEYFTYYSQENQKQQTV